MIGFDEYYLRSEVSNSDLSKLKDYFMPKSYIMDSTAAYRFGNLIDAMVTESHRVDNYRMRVDNEQFLASEWDLALEMKKAFFRDPMCQQLHKLCSGQAIKAGPITLNHRGIEFTLPMRCKYDLWSDALNWGGDLKSTTATTQKQFEEACYYFDYDRQRANYMRQSGAKKDVLIGISKVNLQIFKIHITEDTPFYKSGKEKFEYWAFKYWTLFGDINLNNQAA